MRRTGDEFFMLFLVLINVLAISGIYAQEISECLNGLEYIYLGGTAIFATAEINCRSFSSSATLAVYDDLQTFNFVLAFATEQDEDYPFWTGYKRVNLQDSPEDPLSYGIEPGNFGSVAGIFPWLANEPGRIDDTNCIRVESQLDNPSWSPQNCEAVIGIPICQRACSQLVNVQQESAATFQIGFIFIGYAFGIPLLVGLYLKLKQLQKKLDATLKAIHLHTFFDWDRAEDGTPEKLL